MTLPNERNGAPRRHGAYHVTFSQLGANDGRTPVAALTPTLRLCLRLWKDGCTEQPTGAVFVSMNDYRVYKARDVPRVMFEGLRFRQSWPVTPGSLGLWVAQLPGKRTISVSIWQHSEALSEFVRSPRHRMIMRTHQRTGQLITTAWLADRFDRHLIWSQVEQRLTAPFDLTRAPRADQP